MIYVLTLLACLSAKPEHCDRIELQVQACDAAGVAQLAMWAIHHPDWRVQKWNCSGGQQT